MSDIPTSALEQVLEVARKNLLSKQADTVERTDRIRAAVEAYLGAVQTEVAAEFAAKNGIAAPHAGTTPLGAALALRAAVEGLPELRSRVAAPAPAAAPPPPPSVPMSAHAPMAAPPPSVPRAAEPPDPEPSRPMESKPATSRPSVTTTHMEPDPATVSLIRDVQSIDLARMPMHLFRAWAEELAARARALQDRGADSEEVPSRVIRKLTAIAYEKGIGDIFGLNRKHSANWDEVAERARARRELAMTSSANAAAAAAHPHTQKIAIPEVVRTKVVPEDAAPVSAPISVSEAKHEEEEPESVKRLELSNLRAATDHGPVVLVGGVVKQEKVALIASKFGIEVEWVDTSRHGTQAISGLEKRIREKRLAAVVVLQGLIGHKHFEPIVSAARLVGLPFAYADKAGLGSVSRAFFEIEKHLTDAITPRAATSG